MIVGMLDGSAEVRIILGGQDAQVQRVRDDTPWVSYLTHRVLLVRSNLGKKFPKMEVRKHKFIELTN